MGLMDRIIVYATEAEWLMDRPKHINASEVSTILGINPYESAYTLWAEKSGLLPAKDTSFAMQWGHAVEQAVLQAFSEETGIELFGLPKYAAWTHPENSWLHCTPDDLGMLDPHGDPVCVIEAKHTGSLSTSKDMDVDAVLGHQLQLQIQMACTGIHKGYIAAVAHNPTRLIIHEYEYDFDLVERIIPRLRQFLSMVESSIAPEVDGTDSTTATLKALHPDDNGEEIILGMDALFAVEEMEQAKQDEKLAKLEIAKAQNELREALGPNTYGRLSDGRIVSLKTQERAEHTVAASKFRVLRVNKPKR